MEHSPRSTLLAVRGEGSARLSWAARLYIGVVVVAAAARVAEELGDQASCRGRNNVAVDSKTTSSRPSTATFRHHRISPNGPRMITAAAATTTTPI